MESRSKAPCPSKYCSVLFWSLINGKLSNSSRIAPTNLFSAIKKGAPGTRGTRGEFHPLTDGIQHGAPPLDAALVDVSARAWECFSASSERTAAIVSTFHFLSIIKSYRSSIWHMEDKISLSRRLLCIEKKGISTRHAARDSLSVEPSEKTPRGFYIRTPPYFLRAEAISRHSLSRKKAMFDIDDIVFIL